MNRKRLILVILLGLLALCVAYAYLASPRLEKAPPREAGKRTVPLHVKTNKKSSEKGTQRVPLELLQKESQPFPGAERDIFRFKAPSRPISAPAADSALAAPLDPIPFAQPEPVMPTSFDVVQKSLGRFLFLGFLEKGGEKTVFLSTGGELFVVKRGERFGSDREFLVSDIQEKTLFVKSSGGQTVKIALIENEKLKPTVSAPVKRPGTSLPGPGLQHGFSSGRPGTMARPTGARPPGGEVEAELEPAEESTMPNDASEEAPRESGDVLQGEANGTTH